MKEIEGLIVDFLMVQGRITALENDTRVSKDETVLKAMGKVSQCESVLTKAQSNLGQAKAEVEATQKVANQAIEVELSTLKVEKLGIQSKLEKQGCSLDFLGASPRVPKTTWL